MRKSIWVLVLLVLLSSCAVTEDLRFDSSDSYKGKSLTLYEPDVFFTTVMEDMLSWKEDGNNSDIMDTAVVEFRENVLLSDTASDVLFFKVGENKYVGSFSFSDFRELTRDLSNDYPDQKLVTIGKTAVGTNRFELNINLETYDVLATVVPFLNNDDFKVWGPVYNNPPYDTITEEDYKDMVSWVLGEDGPESIDASSISLTLHFPSRIIKTNGQKLNDTEVSFSFPLIDFLLLHEPIVFWCEF